MALVIAHRGSSAERPENTIASIQHAIDIGADCIEIDIQLSKDKVPVVFHDSTIHRTTDHKKPVLIEDLDLVDLKQLDAGSWFDRKFTGEKIPTLEEVLRLNRGSSKLMLELKKGKYSAHEIVKNVADCIQKAGQPSSSYLIGSFDVEILAELKKQIPHISRIGIAQEISMLSVFAEMGIQHYALCHTIITDSLMDSMHMDGIEIWTFTVDDLEVCQYLRTLKTHGIITNHPRQLRTVSLN